MKAHVTWQKDLQFLGEAQSGFPVKLDSHSSADTGVSPVEMVAIALAGCTAMDVVSILVKKQMKVSSFEVKFDGDRAAEHPKRFTKAVLEYVVHGQGIKEDALVRAIELSVTKYCSVHAMLNFPVDLTYSIYEGDQLVKQGTYRH